MIHVYIVIIVNQYFIPEPNGKGGHEEDNGRYRIEEVKDRYKSNFSHTKASNLTVFLAIFSVMNYLSSRFYIWR